MNKNKIQSEFSKTDNQLNLVVYNDDVNSFQKVILCFMKFLNHDIVQAEQCATIIHHTGSCKVKNGSYIQLEEIKNQFDLVGLNCKIE